MCSRLVPQCRDTQGVRPFGGYWMATRLWQMPNKILYSWTHSLVGYWVQSQLRGGVTGGGLYKSFPLQLPHYPLPATVSWAALLQHNSPPWRACLPKGPMKPHWNLWNWESKPTNLCFLSFFFCTGDRTQDPMVARDGLVALSYRPSPSSFLSFLTYLAQCLTTQLDS